MGNIHNTRILRFLIILAIVVLTIFIYASYSSNAQLTPSPHMRGSSPSAAQYALNDDDDNDDTHRFQYQHHDIINKSTVDIVLLHQPDSDSQHRQQQQQQQSHYKKSLPSGDGGGLIYAKHQQPQQQQQHHRTPTIDEDALADGGSIGAAAIVPASPDGVLDEVALNDEAAALVQNELTEEQFMQNIVNALGSANNSSGMQSQQSLMSQVQPDDEQQQQLSQQQEKQQQKQQQQRNQLPDNSLNKIPESDVLIPTSNLQKFIENADKILKNMTGPVPVPAAPINASRIDSKAPPASNQQQQQSQSAGNGENDDIDSDEALPPSVVMTIRNQGSGVAVVKQQEQQQQSPSAAAGDNANKNNNNSKQSPPPAPKIPVNSSTSKTSVIDPTQGIPTQQIYESGHMNEEIDIERICPNQGADLKLLVLITSAQAHSEARLSIRQTWGHYGVRRDVSTAFILGRSPNETLNAALTRENFIYGDLVRGHFIDSYNNLTLKTISALEWVDEHCPRAKYLLKTDDDMFINVPKLLAFLDGHAKEKRVIYGRLAKKWKPIRNKKSKYYVSTGQFAAAIFPPFTTGPAYVMTSDVIHELYVRSLHQVYLKLEDVFTTGIVAQQLGIKRVHANEFLNRRIAFNPCNIRKSISVHMIKSNEQFDLWKKLLDQTTKCK